MGCCGSRREYEDDDESFKRVGKYGRLSCWYTNATSLKNKIALVAAKNNEYDVLMVTETWLNETCNAEIEGYKCFRQDRTSGKTGGGVCIYVRECFTSCPVSTEKSTSTAIATAAGVEIEQVWCHVKIDSKRILIGKLTNKMLFIIL